MEINFITMFIKLYLLIIGIKIVHRTTWLKAGLSIYWHFITTGRLLIWFLKGLVA
jgi:hypothetical protein